MSRTESAANLITRAKERADMENNNFVSDPEWYRSLNVWTAKLWNQLVKADPDRYTRYETLTASGTTTDFSMPTDYYGTVTLAYVSSATDGLYVPIDRLYGEDQYTLLHEQANVPTGYTFVYNATTPSTPLLRILPPPDRNLRHGYLVAPPKYATDGTDANEEIAGIAGLEEYVVIGMAIDARIKEQSSVVQLRQSQAEMIQHLEEAAENRSIDSAGHVHDSRKNGYIDPASQRWGVRY